jgi:hypothetical protein
MTALQAEADIAEDGSVTLTRPLPAWVRPGRVQMTLLVDEVDAAADERLERRRRALAHLRQADPFREIADPSAWQREIRRDRAVPAHD